MGWPLLTLGGLETLAAIFYAVQVGGEIDHYESALAADLAVFRREELAHIQGTTSRFLFYRLAEVTLALGGAGVSTYGFIANRDVYEGIGIGVFALALPLLLIDTVNDGRATRYQDRVNRFDPSAHTSDPASLGITPTPWYASFGGTHACQEHALLRLRYHGGVAQFQALQSGARLLVDKDKLAGVPDANVEHLQIVSADVLKMIRRGDARWEPCVPQKVKDAVKQHGLFDYRPHKTSAD